MRKLLKSVTLLCAIAGMSSTAYANGGQCVILDAKGATLINMSKGQIFKFVPQNNALMRNVNAQSLTHVMGKVASVKLQPRCTATLLGNGGAKWGHMPVKKSGPTGVPAAHVYGVSCGCQ